jgi:putative flippase GtrA
VTDSPQAADLLEPSLEKPTASAALPRFLLVGATGVVVTQALLFAYHGLLGAPVWLATALATEAAIVNNYVGNELFTFHLRQLHFPRLVRFNLVALGGLAVTTVVTTVLANSGVFYLAANLIGIGAGSGVNFAVNFLWTWRD